MAIYLESMYIFFAIVIKAKQHTTFVFFPELASWISTRCTPGSFFLIADSEFTANLQ